MHFSFQAMWESMGLIAKTVVFILFFMSVLSIAVGVERFIVFLKAKKQSNILLRLISKLWQEGKIEESTKLSTDKKFKNSHLAKVLVAGLNEMQFQKDSNAPHAEVVESAKRAIERATIKGIQEFKRGFNSLATVGSLSKARQSSLVGQIGSGTASILPSPASTMCQLIVSLTMLSVLSASA